MVKEATRTTVPARLAKAKDASWLCNLLSGVFGVKVAAAGKCSASGLEPSIVWFVMEPDGAGARSIFTEQSYARNHQQGSSLF
jgi:hypothetical protein